MTSAKMKNPAALGGGRGVRKTNASEEAQRKNSTVEVSNAEFLAHAFAGCGADETPWVTGFAGDVASAAHSVWFGRSALPLPACIRSNNNNYLSISTFKRGLDGQYRRRKDLWTGLWLVLLDDIGTKIERAAALRLPPSCLVETSPGNFQAWLFLNEPERNQPRAESLINGLIKAGATDEGAGSLPRYGRLPQGINGKAKYRTADNQVFTQKVHIWEPARRYTPEQIAEAYGFELNAISQQRPRTKARNGEAQATDGYVTIIEGAGLYLEPVRGSIDAHLIICPWVNSHTDKGTTGTAYFAPSEENDWRGGFKCHHGHCKGRNIDDFDLFVRQLLSRRAA